MALAKSNLKVEFPFSAWEEELLQNIGLVIKQAWGAMLLKYNDMIDQDENQITEHLQDELERILVSDKNEIFNRRKFQSVVRNGSVCSFDGRSIEKNPDLTLKLVNIRPGIEDTRYDGLFVECKVLDKGSWGLKYIENGIARFVDGEYAWAMPHAMMLGYVRAKNMSISAIDQSFKRNSTKETVYRCQPKDNIKLGKTTCPQTFFSVHVRPWCHKEYGIPGPIRIDHLWLHIQM